MFIRPDFGNSLYSSYQFLGYSTYSSGSQPTNFYGRFISERSESAGKRSARLPKPPDAEEIPEPPSSPVEGHGHFSEWGTRGFEA